MKNVQFVAGFYLDYIKLFDDLKRAQKKRVVKITRLDLPAAISAGHRRDAGRIGHLIMLER